MKCFKKI